MSETGKRIGFMAGGLLLGLSAFDYWTLRTEVKTLSTWAAMQASPILNRAAAALQAADIVNQQTAQEVAARPSPSPTPRKK